MKFQARGAKHPVDEIILLILIRTVQYGKGNYQNFPMRFYVERKACIETNVSLEMEFLIHAEIHGSYNFLSFIVHYKILIEFGN